MIEYYICSIVGLVWYRYIWNNYILNSMKHTLSFILILFSISYFGCDTGLTVTPNNTNVDTTWYTIEGKYLNGTTNIPYRNIELTLKLDNYGFPRVLEEISGPILTDNEGYFKFKYQHLDRLKGVVFLKVYPTDIYPNIDSIPINENVNITKYKSTYGSLVLILDPVSSNELYVCIAGQADTLHYTNLTATINDTIKSYPNSSALLAWGRTKEELRQAIKSGNGNKSYVKISGDPFINYHKITF